MNIDPKNLPDGTVVEVCPTDEDWRSCAYVRADGKVGYTEPGSDFNEAPLITRVFVPVPDGVTVEDAENALAALVPADPDADLIERMAGTIGGQFSCSGEPVVSNVYREVARAVLAVVREGETR